MLTTYIDRHMKPLNISVCGATGAVGEQIPQLLKNKDIPINNLHLFGSERSAGRTIETPYGNIEIQQFLESSVAQQSDIVFLCVGGEHSKEHAPGFAEKGIITIDNSSAFRYDEDVPLVVPGVNSHAIGEANLIANPNCTTAIGMMPVAPIAEKYGLKRLKMSTYQAASGAGRPGMEELYTGMEQVVNEETVSNEVFAHPLAGNVIPHIDAFQDNGYTKEEMKVVWETRKILGLDNLPASCTAVRIPTERSHAEAISLETQHPVDLDELRQIWEETAGLKVSDDPENNAYPMPLNTSNNWDVEVGRLRHDVAYPESKNHLEFFVCGDQLLRGAALNAVEIADEIIKQRFQES